MPALSLELIRDSNTRQLQCCAATRILCVPRDLDSDDRTCCALCCWLHRVSSHYGTQAATGFVLGTCECRLLLLERGQRTALHVGWLGWARVR